MGRRSVRYGALNSNEFDAATSGLDKMFERVLEFKRNDLTVQEIEGVVDPQWLDLAKQAHTVLGVSGAGSIEVFLNDPLGRADGRTVTINILRKRGSFPFVYSRKIGMHRDQRGTFDDALTAKLNKWAKWRLETARRWAEARELLNYFDARCKTPSEMRFYLPFLLTLMKKGGASETSLKKVRTLKVPKTIFPLPPEVKQAAIDAGVLVNSFLLYPDKVPDDVEAEPIKLTVDKDYSPFDSAWGSKLRVI